MTDITLPTSQPASPPPIPHRWRTLVRTWGPVILIMVAIFIASAQPKTAPPDGAQTLYFSGPMPIFIERTWDALIKKSAHVLGYALLTAALLRALRRDGHPAREAAYTALLLAICYALTDELHQAFVAGRNASVLDIGFDYIGAATVTLIRRRSAYTHPGHSKKAHLGVTSALECSETGDPAQGVR